MLAYIAGIYNLAPDGQMASKSVIIPPYIVIYRIMNQEVCIMRIPHSAQRWPPIN